MFGSTWYYGTLRKYIILFGTLFNNVYINRQLNSGQLAQTIKVPLTYSPKEKMLARLKGDPNLNRPVAMSLPVMSFEILGMEYDPTRKLNTINKFVNTKNTDKSQQKFQYNPVPYNIQFNLNIMVKNAEDGNRILEQILPYFTPEWTATVNLVPDMGIKLDVPIILNSVDMQDSYEGDFGERRAMVWTLSFILKGYIFGPTKKQKVIKFANTNLYISAANNIADDLGNITYSESIKIKPGLLANGSPTSNSSLSVATDEITLEDNYGFIIDFDRGI
jgi:hypothetical protein